LIACGGIKTPCDRCEKFKPEERARYGCDSPAPHPIWNLGDEPIYECPGRLVREDLEVQSFLRIYSVLKVFQALPAPGGLLDQSELFLQAFSVVEGQINEYESQEMKKDDRHAG